MAAIKKKYGKGVKYGESHREGRQESDEQDRNININYGILI